MARELDPCGTVGAHHRHVQNHEPIDDACRQAWHDYRQENKPVSVRVTLPPLADAACATPRGRRLFADITPDVVPDAREICRSCPGQAACLQWGVLYEDEGMWGGLTRDELRRERYRHNIRRREPYSGWAAPRPAGSPGRKELAELRAARPLAAAMPEPSFDTGTDLAVSDEVREWAISEGWHVPDGRLPGGIVAAYLKDRGGAR